MDILVDSNVILDLLSPGSAWREWSSSQIATLATRRQLVINPIIYAEISFGFTDREMLDSIILPSQFRRDQLPYEAAFLAAQSHRLYRERGGVRTPTLPDFFIGAHAVVAGLPLLARDKGRYLGYFPQVQLIAPDA